MSQSIIRNLVIGALLAAFATPGLATPINAVADDVESLKERNFDCKDKLVVAVFSKYSSLASSICSSYIPAKTATAVVVSHIPPTWTQHGGSKQESPSQHALSPSPYLSLFPSRFLQAYPHHQRKSQ